MPVNHWEDVSACMKDSPCYVYAILGHKTPIPAGLTGLENAPLSAVPWQALRAAVSPIEQMALPPTSASLLRHEAVVEALCQAGPALPVRFGTILAGPEAVARALAGRYEVLLADLARVGTKAELGLTILWGAEDGRETHKQPQQTGQTGSTLATGSSGPGTRYLQARLVQYQGETVQYHKANTLIAEVKQALHAATVEQRYRLLQLPRLAVRATYLVHPWQVKEAQQAVDELRQRHPDLRWLLSGPWPPYSFVTGASKPFQQSPGLKLDSLEDKGGTI